MVSGGGNDDGQSGRPSTGTTSTGVYLCIVLFVLGLLLFFYLRQQQRLQDAKLDRLARKCGRMLREADVLNVVQDSPEFQLLLSQSTDAAVLSQDVRQLPTRTDLNGLQALVTRHADVLARIEQRMQTLEDGLQNYHHVQESARQDNQSRDSLPLAAAARTASTAAPPQPPVPELPSTLSYDFRKDVEAWESSLSMGGISRPQNDEE